MFPRLSLGLTCCLPPGIQLIFFFLSFSGTSVTACPVGSSFLGADVQADLGMEAESSFLLAAQEGKVLTVWAAAPFWAPGRAAHVLVSC